MINQNLEAKLWNISVRLPFQSVFFILPEKDKRLDIRKVFPKEYSKLTLELGSGWGEVACDLALKNPDTGYILMEKKGDRLRRTIQYILARNIQNIRIMPVNFDWFLTEIFDENQFDEIILNFPDPWPKKKHRKNRSLNPGFLGKIHFLLKQNGLFRFATDYGPYARRCIFYFRKETRFKNPDKEYSFSRHDFPVSRFEREKTEQGCRIYFLERRKS